MNRSPILAFFFVLLCLAIPTLQHAQLIENGGFETMEDCPDAFTIDVTIGTSMESWFAVQGSPDGYHMQCEALSPVFITGIAQPSLGDGLAGLFANREFIGQTLNEPLSKDSVYCMSFLSILSTVVESPALADSMCTKVSVYGANNLIEEVDIWGDLVSVDELPGTHFLGASIANMDQTYWTQQTFNFQPDTTYNQLLISTWQDAYCDTVNSYICVDQFVLNACEPVGIAERTPPKVTVFPNPTTSKLHVQGLPPGDWEALIRKTDGGIALRTRVGSSGDVDVSKLAVGIYLLHLPEIGGVEPLRFVVQ